MSNKLIQIYKARGEIQAEIIKGLLESYGIPALVKSDAAPSAFQFTVDKMGEYKVMVSEKDADDARELINNGSVKAEDETDQ
jgi:hypothetical protein